MIGRMVDRFRIVGSLGHGGMGSVWKAEDTLLHQKVALKILSEQWTETPAGRQRFLREARAAASLSHPSVATVFGAGESGDLVYIALALIDGETVADLVARGPLEWSDVVRLGLSVAEALAHAHARRVIHRDISSRNIMIDRDGRVFVLDFGLAIMVDRTRLTSSAVGVMGTAPYMAPEVILGHDADARADLYGLGVVLFEALTGVLPFASERPEGVMYAAVHEPAPAPGTRRAGVPAWLDAIVLRLLAKRPDDRFADADALIAAFRESAGGESGVRVQHARVGSASESADRPPVRANRVWLAPILGIGSEAASDDTRAQVRALTDALLAATGALPSVEVISPDAETPDADLPGLRRQAARHGARMLLSGSLRRSGAQVRLTWTLVEAAAGTVLGGETLTAGHDATFEIEDRLTEGVLAALRKAVGAREGAANDPDAHRSFLDALSRLEHSDSEQAVTTAIEELERLRDRRGDTASVHAALGRAYLRRYQMRPDRAFAVQAADACQRAIALDPHMSDVFVTLGDLHVATGRHDPAIAAYRDALVLRPESAEAWSGLALAAIKAGRFPDAEDASRRLIALRPESWRGHSRLGHVFYQQGRYAEAIGPWSEVTRLAPDNPLGHANLANALFSSNRLDPALAEFRRACELEPTAAAHAGLGTVLYYLGRFAESAAAFEEAVRVHPDDARMWGNLADAYEELPDGAARMAEARDRAIALMLERLEINPGDADSWLSLAQWRAARDEHDEARECLGRALALAPADASIRARAGTTLAWIGDRDAALIEFEEAFRRGYRVEMLLTTPRLAPLREDPRFQTLLDRYPPNGGNREPSPAPPGGRT
jgi:serine/threonine protein kinase/tetratricopeptide (TPR) repeat protein